MKKQNIIFMLLSAIIALSMNIIGSENNYHSLNALPAKSSFEPSETLTISPNSITTTLLDTVTRNESHSLSSLTYPTARTHEEDILSDIEEQDISLRELGATNTNKIGLPNFSPLPEDKHLISYAYRRMLSEQKRKQEFFLSYFLHLINNENEERIRCTSNEHDNWKTLHKFHTMQILDIRRKQKNSCCCIML